MLKKCKTNKLVVFSILISLFVSGCQEENKNSSDKTSTELNNVSLPDAAVLQENANLENPSKEVALDLTSTQSKTLKINRCESKKCRFDKEYILVKLKDESTLPVQKKTPRKAQSKALSAQVTLNDRILESANRIKLFKNAKRSTTSRKIITPSGKLISAPDLTRWYKIKLPAGTSPEEALDSLEIDDRIEVAEYNLERSLTLNSVSPNDSQIDDQWYLDTAKIPQAWDWLETNGYQPGGDRSVVTAVIDTGVDYNHEDLMVNMWVNQGEIADNGIDDDNNGYIDDIHGISTVGSEWDHNGDPMDDHGHGTHVAGVIAAQANNGKGIAGIAYNSQIMAIKAAQYSGSLTATDIAEALIYASEQGADVINMSFGGTGRSLLEEDALAVAFGKAVLIASAGNNGLPNEKGCTPIYGSSYPASYNWVLGVMAESPTANSKGDYLAGFSNWDCKEKNGIEYEVMAPGVDILSTLPNNNYGSWDGTSMAAPVVSGIAALLRTRFNDKAVHSSRFLMGQLGATGQSKQGKTYSDSRPPKFYSSSDALAALTDTPKPSLQYLEHWLWDESTTEVNNDNDGIVDAGETIDLALVVRNYWGQADNVQVSIEAITEGIEMTDPYISWVTNTVDYGSVGTYSNDDNGLIYENDEVTGVNVPFTFTVDEKTPNNHIIPFKVTLSATNGLDDQDATVYTSTSRFSLLVQRGRELPSIIAGDAVGTDGGDLDTDGIEDGIVTLDNTALYIIDKPVLIEQGVTLKVGPGAVIQWWGSQPDDTYAVFRNAYLQVEGRLEVVGSVEQPVTLKPSDLFPERMVVIKQAGSNASGHISYADLTNPYISGTFGSNTQSPLFEHVRIRRGSEGYSLFYEKNESGNWRTKTSAHIDAAISNSQLIELGGTSDWETEDVRASYSAFNVPNIKSSLIERSYFKTNNVTDDNVLLLNYKVTPSGYYHSSKIENANPVQDFKVLDSFDYEGKTYALFHSKHPRSDEKLLDDAQTFAQSISAASHVVTLSDYNETIAINDWLWDRQQRSDEDWSKIPGCVLSAMDCQMLSYGSILTGLKRDTGDSYKWLNEEVPSYDVTQGQYYWDPVQWTLDNAQTPSDAQLNYERKTNALAIIPVKKLSLVLKDELQSLINNTFSSLDSTNSKRSFEPDSPLTLTWIQTRLETYITDKQAFELEKMLSDQGYTTFQACFDANDYDCINAGTAEQWKLNLLAQWQSWCDDGWGCSAYPPNYLAWYNAKNNGWQGSFNASYSGFFSDMSSHQYSSLVMIEINSEQSLTELQQQVLVFKSSWQSDWFKNNAILNQWWDANPDHWLQIDVDTAAADRSRFYSATMDLSGNYWGTSNTNLIDYSVLDYSDDFNKPAAKYSPILSTAPETAYPFVADVQLLDSDSGARPDLRFGAEQMIWQVNFNRDMDQAVQPNVSYGPDYPYTDFSVDGDWIDARTWQGSVNISPVASDGYQYVRVQGAVAADDAWLVTGNDYARYRFEVITSGTESLNLQASGGDGYVDLTWSQDDFDLLHGFNLYRSTSSDSGFTRIHQSLLANSVRSYRDENIQPGVTYYYHFKVMTEAGESEPSNTSSATPTDTVKPELSYAPVSTAAFGANLLIQATAMDNIAVSSVTLYYRTQGNADYIQLDMTNSTGNEYRASIPGSAMVAPGVDYYIEVSDGASYAFGGRADTPHTVNISDSPVVTNLAPISGSALGGTKVTITGANFKSGASVSIGEAMCTPVEFISSSQIKCDTAAHYPGTVAMMVSNSESSQGQKVNAFTYFGSDVSVGIADTIGSTGSVIDVALNISGVTGLASYQATVNYDKTKLRLNAVRKGNLVSAWSIDSNESVQGSINIAAASASETTSGAGELAVLEFVVLAADQATTSIISLASISLNDDAISATTFDGDFTYFEGYSLSGNVAYWGDFQQKVSAEISLNGASATNSSVDSGDYQVVGVHAGANSLSIAKSDQADGISAYDASLILMHATGKSTLTGSAEKAADANNSGSITAQDAFEILNNVAGLRDLPFNNQLSSWQFEPPVYDIENMTASQNDINFSAILIGDVSGNWQSNAISANASQASASVFLYNRRQLPSGEITVDLSVKTGDLDVTGIELQLNFTSSAELVQVTQANAVADWSLVVNDSTANQVNIAMASSKPLVDGSTILTLTFNVSDQLQSLSVATGQLNEMAITTVEIPLINSASDIDDDGVDDYLDAFVNNSAASVDTDLDGKPDSFHGDCNDECIAASGLVLDLDDDNDGVPDSEDFYPKDPEKSEDNSMSQNIFTLDVNGDGKVSLPIDGFIILRSMVGFPAPALASDDDMLDTSRTRNEMSEILNSAKDNLVLDINGDGKVSLPIDGFIILRHMVGFPASALASDEDMADASRTRDEMKSYMESFQ